jgi:hypothetical protein
VRLAALGTAIVAAVVDVLYIRYVTAQQGSDPQFLDFPFVASFIALMAMSAAFSVPARVGWRPFLLGISAGGLLLLGLFAIFSIGLALIIPGVVALYGVTGAVADLRPSDASSGAVHKGRRRAGIATAVAGVVTSVVVLLAGFSVTETFIRCRPSGSESGGGITVLGFSYTYRCDNGKLTISR